MEKTIVNGYHVAGNDYLAIAISVNNPADAHYFYPHTDGIEMTAFERAIAWTSPGL